MDINQLKRYKNQSSAFNLNLISFWNWIYVIRNVSFKLTFDFKKLLENELRFVTDVVLEYFAMLEV